MDLPSGILAQLGLKIQHALRAFTANDRQAIKQTADNYPSSDFYKTDEVLTSLGIGEAFVTALSEKGTPTPLAATMLRAPESRMDILSTEEIASINASSKLVKKYAESIDRESAFELLAKRISVEEEATIAQTNNSNEAKKPSAKADDGISKSVIKVVSSASFIRGAFGIIMKLLKK